MQRAIADNAYRNELARERGEAVTVGVNKYADGGTTTVPIQRIDQTSVDRQVAEVKDYRARQDQPRVEAALSTVAVTAEGGTNLLPPMKEALLAGATLGQVVTSLRGVFGEHKTRA
jgi:methylmalonyl-CoA mutase N-terminal domain/subunit